MSRTKRRYPTEFLDCRSLMISKRFNKRWGSWRWMDEIGIDYLDCHVWEVYGLKIGYDRKPWNKPSKAFKQLKRSVERAKVKNAIRQEKWDLMPIFPKTDEWEWT